MRHPRPEVTMTAAGQALGAAGAAGHWETPDGQASYAGAPGAAWVPGRGEWRTPEGEPSSAGCERRRSAIVCFWPILANMGETLSKKIFQS